MTWHNRPNAQLVEPGDLNFWRSLWKSEGMKAWLCDDPNQTLEGWIKKAAERPWWFIDPEQDYERRHFSVWFGQTVLRRQYPSKELTDLYYLHDLIHGITLQPQSFNNEDHWRLYMRANEIAVSIETELLIHWRCSSLRAPAFEFPIWHDELTFPLRPDLRERLVRQRLSRQSSGNEKGDYEKNLLSLCPQSLVFHWNPAAESDALDGVGLWDLRRAVTRWPDQARATEVAMQHYESKSIIFYDGWAGSWEAVEADRLRFDALCAEGSWRRAVKEREEGWGRSANEHGVPYGKIAQWLFDRGI